MLEVEGLWKRFGAVQAVAGVSFSVRAGEVLAVLGPNGAGKSTTMRMIAGSLEPDAGRVRICGADVVRERFAAQKSLGYLPEGAPAYADMTALGFLGFFADARGLSGPARRAAIETALARTDLAATAHRPIDTLSKGLKRRVGLAGALLHSPPVLVLDEPTDGLDPNQKFAVRAMIRDIAASTAIVVSTHILEEVEAISTRALVIAAGRVVADETPAALAARHPSGRLDAVFRLLTTAPDVSRDIFGAAASRSTDAAAA